MLVIADSAPGSALLESGQRASRSAWAQRHRRSGWPGSGCSAVRQPAAGLRRRAIARPVWRLWGEELEERAKRAQSGEAVEEDWGAVRQRITDELTG